MSGALDPQGRRVLYYNGVWREEAERLDVKSRKFSPLQPNARVRQAAFSRDGQWMAYIDWQNGSLVRSRADGTEPVVLAPGGTYHPGFPRLSPDGKWIVFGGTLKGQAVDTFVVPSSGGYPEHLLEGQTDMRDADWSSDGRKLVLSRTLGSKSSESRELVIVDFETRHAEKLPGSDKLVASRWSPDGRFISATVDDESELRLWAFSSRKWTVIARGAALRISVWSPDSRYLYFQDLLSNGQSLQRYDLHSGRVEVVAEFSEILKSGAADRCSLEGTTADGAPVIDFNRGAYDLFAAALRLP